MVAARRQRFERLVSWLAFPGTQLYLMTNPLPRGPNRCPSVKRAVTFAAEAVGGAMFGVGNQDALSRADAVAHPDRGRPVRARRQGIKTALALKTIMPVMSMVAALSATHAAHSDEMRNADRKHSNWSPSYGKYTCSVLENVVPRSDN